MDNSKKYEMKEISVYTAEGFLLWAAISCVTVLLMELLVVGFFCAIGIYPSSPIRYEIFIMPIIFGLFGGLFLGVEDIKVKVCR